MQTQRDPVVYAGSLVDYAGSRLDAASLDAWLVHRLMLDCRLERDAAAALASATLDARAARRRRGSRSWNVRRLLPGRAPSRLPAAA